VRYSSALAPKIGIGRFLAILLSKLVFQRAHAEFIRSALENGAAVCLRGKTGAQLGMAWRGNALQRPEPYCCQYRFGRGTITALFASNCRQFTDYYRFSLL